MNSLIEYFDNIIRSIDPFIIQSIKYIIIVIFVFISLSLIFRLIKKGLLKRTKSKKQASNVTVFLDLLKYLFIFLFVIIVLFSFSNSWTELGFVAGLLSVALGWALQKPISGVLAWLVIITRRPINIGDRVIIKKMIGDIRDISLTHIILDEVGGTIDGEEGSGRTIMVPNSLIFEEELINYNEKNEYILDEIKTSITYESELKKAEKIVIESVEKILKDDLVKIPKKYKDKVHTRINFLDSGVELTVRYYTIATSRNQISTDIRREIHNKITKDSKIEFAYPHTEVLFRNK